MLSTVEPGGISDSLQDCRMKNGCLSTVGDIVDSALCLEPGSLLTPSNMTLASRVADVGGVCNLCTSSCDWHGVGRILSIYVTGPFEPASWEKEKLGSVLQWDRQSRSISRPRPSAVAGLGQALHILRHRGDDEELSSAGRAPYPAATGFWQHRKRCLASVPV